MGNEMALFKRLPGSVFAAFLLSLLGLSCLSSSALAQADVAIENFHDEHDAVSPAMFCSF